MISLFLSIVLTQFLALQSNPSISGLASAVATWSANPSGDGTIVYRLYYGTTSKNYTTTIDISAPLTTTTISNLNLGKTYYFAIQARAAVLFSALSPEVALTIPQPPCLDTNGNPSVQLRVLSFTSSLAAGGLGQLLWTITSLNRIVNITATLTANSTTTPISVMDGADSKTVDFSHSAGVNFTAPSKSGNYSLVVSATDVNGCKEDTSSINRIINVP